MEKGLRIKFIIHSQYKYLHGKIVASQNRYTELCVRREMMYPFLLHLSHKSIQVKPKFSGAMEAEGLPGECSRTSTR